MTMFTGKRRRAKRVRQARALRLPEGVRPRDGRPHVVVVGGGFGGLSVARDLSTPNRRRSIRVTVVDRRNHHTFQPLLYQVASAGLQPQDIGVPFRAILRRRGVGVRFGEVQAIDTETRTIRFADGATLDYDHLVLGMGAVTSDFGVPGVAEHAFGLKSLADATTLRNHVLRRFEEASAAPHRVSPGDLTFVVAGGGPTGVELAGSLAELVDLVIRRDHPHLDVARIRIVLVEMADRLLGGFGERSAELAREGLLRRGVEVRLGTGIGRAEQAQVELDDGEVIPTRTLVWAAGVAGNPLAASLGIELDRGRRIPVDRRLRVEAAGFDDVYVIGDLAGAKDPEGNLLPQVAPVAIQQGRYVADLLAAERGLARDPGWFRYRDKGSMATIGRAAAVVELPGGVRFGGVGAWFAWLVLHLLQLVGFKNRFRVLLSWAWNYLAYDHAARLILDQKEADTTESGGRRVRRSWADAERAPQEGGELAITRPDARVVERPEPDDD